MNLWSKNGGYVTSLLCQSSSTYRLGDVISQVTFCLGLGWTVAQSDKEQPAHRLTGRHGVGVAWTWDRARPAPGLSAPGQANKSQITVITDIKLPSVKTVWFGLLSKVWDCKISCICCFSSKTLMAWHYTSAWSCFGFVLNTVRNSICQFSVLTALVFWTQDG